MTVKTESIDHSSIIPVPIRIHAGASKRGRKLSDYKRTLLSAAVQEVRSRRRKGDVVSVREIAEFHGVAKSTLHRYLRPDECELSPPHPSTPVPSLPKPTSALVPTPNKLAIDFLVDRSNTTTTAIHNNLNTTNSNNDNKLTIKRTSAFIASPTDLKFELAIPKFPSNVHNICRALDNLPHRPTF